VKPRRLGLGDLPREMPWNAAEALHEEGRASGLSPSSFKSGGKAQGQTILSGRSNVKIMWQFSLDAFWALRRARTRPEGAWGARSPRRRTNIGVDNAIHDARMRARK
jgi:hypothetical protein